MRRILIAEDEKHIRLGLRAMVQRSGVPVEEILEARDGEEALAILKDGGADLLITDVRMPRLDGIGLVEAAMKLPQPPLVLVISGYDDFSYAVAMLRRGVQDYLLKPVERKQLYDALEKLESRYQALQEGTRRERERRDRDLRLLALEPEAPERAGLLERYRADFYPGRYRVVCSREAVEGAALAISARHGLTLCLVPEGEEAVPAISGRSGVHAGLEELAAACREAELAWKRSFLAGAPANWQEFPEKALTVTCRQLMDHLSVSRAKELNRLLAVQCKAAAQGEASPDAFAGLCAELAGQMGAVYRNLLAPGEDAARFADLWSFESGQAYLEAFGGWSTALSGRIGVEFANFENKQKIRQAVQYVQEHYRESLNMTLVSNLVSMNYSLFSQLFKQYTGVNFVSYVQKLRLEEAQRLLETTDDRVSEICYQVGFQDDKHFLKVFKSATGLSPSEYRRACIRRNHSER